jgi:hypothetical protein
MLKAQRLFRKAKAGRFVASVIIEPNMLVEVTEREYLELHLRPSFDRMPTLHQFNRDRSTRHLPKTETD